MKKFFSSKVRLGFFAALFLGGSVSLTSFAVFVPKTEAFISSTPVAGTVSVNNTVTAIVTSTSSGTYIGGHFTYAGVVPGGLVSVALSTGTVTAPFPSVNSSVIAEVPDGSGGEYIAGYFTQIGSIVRNYLAHILSNGTVDPNFNPNFNNDVLALALSSDGSTLYVGGDFTTIGGVTYKRLAAINTSNGTASTTFNPNLNNTVHALVLSSNGSTLYTGGNFTTVGSSTYNRLAAIAISNGIASTTFNPNLNLSVSALALSPDGSTLYAGGLFTTVGSSTYNYLAAINTSNGTAVSAFNPNMNNTVNSLALSSSGSTLYVGGYFTTVGGTTYNNVAAVTTSNGTASTTFNPNLNNFVSTLLLSPDGSTLYVGGSFTTVGSSTYNNLAAINISNGVASSTFNPNINGNVYALAFSSNGSQLYAGLGVGSFINGATRNRIAHILPNGTIDPNFNPNLNSDVYAFALSPDSSTLYVGGDFTTISSSTYNYLAAINTSNGTASTTFNPNLNNDVNALALSSDGSKLYIGGSFTIVGTTTRNYLAAVTTSNGVLVSAFNPNANSGVNTLALSSNGSTLYASGYFTTIGGVNYNYLAAVNTSNGTASTTFNPNSNAYIDNIALSPDGSTLYVGGAFTTIGSSTRNNLAAIATSNGVASSTFNPNVNGEVFAVIPSLDGSTLYVGGSFTTVGSSTYNNLAAINISNGVASSTFNPNVNNSVYALALSPDGSSLYPGGIFNTIGGLNNYENFAQFLNITLSTTTTSAASSIGATAATLNGAITGTGNSSITQSGFVYGTSSSLTTVIATTTLGAQSGTTTLSQTISGLTASTTYYFQSYSVNSAGTSTGSILSFTTLNITAPTVSVTPGLATSSLTQTSVTLNATTTSTGNASTTIQGFNYGTTTAYGFVASTTGTFGAGPFSQSISGLSCSTTYHFQAFAINTAGTGTSTDQSFTTSGCTATTYTFTGPSSGNIYATSTNFTVTPNNPYTGTITLTPTGAGSTGLSATVLTFSNSSTSQTFTITPTATGSITLTPTNNGSLSNPSNLTYTVNTTVPSSPTSVSAATSTANQATVSFTVSASNGGSAILYYFASSTPGNFTATSTGSPIVVSGLTNGTSYTFAVYAVNAIGTSTPSSASNSVIPLGLPGAPTSVVATAGNAQASVTFTAPVVTGGTPITGYVVTSNPAGGTDSASGSTTLTHLVTGLSNGTAYTFTVVASNSVGAGTTSSSSNSVTPVTTASVSTNATTNISTTTVTLNASILSTGGSNATQSGFAYGTDPTLTSGVSTSTLGAQTGTASFSQNLSSLTLNTTYYVRAYVVNAVGTTTGSILSFLTLPLPPTVLTVTATPATTSLSVLGSISSVNGVNASARGVVYGATTAYGSTVTESGSFGTGFFPETITGLTCNTPYHVASFATNTGGTTYGADQVATTSACSVVTPPSNPTPTPPVVYASGGGGFVSSANLASLLAPGAAATAYLNSLTAKTPATANSIVSPTPTTSITPATTVPVITAHTFSRNLEVGNSGVDVKTLQKFLNSQGYIIAKAGAGSPGHETTTFGTLTKLALAKFQKAHGLPATGYFGVLTRGVVRGE